VVIWWNQPFQQQSILVGTVGGDILNSTDEKVLETP